MEGLKGRACPSQSQLGAGSSKYAERKSTERAFFGPPPKGYGQPSPMTISPVAAPLHLVPPWLAFSPLLPSRPQLPQLDSLDYLSHPSQQTLGSTGTHSS